MLNNIAVMISLDEKRRKHNGYQKEYMKRYKQDPDNVERLRTYGREKQREYRKLEYVRERENEYRRGPLRKAVTRKYRMKIRETILGLLGNKCIECGANDKRILEIDHINGGGKKSREMFHGNKEEYVYYIKHSDLISSNLQLLCKNCHNIKSYGDNEYQYNHKRRLELVMILGCRCNICGNRDPRVLEFDHIGNNGNVERKLLGGINGVLTHYYNNISELKSNIQLLCGNCHNIKSYHDNPYGVWIELGDVN